jgi:hypothetical protein
MMHPLPCGFLKLGMLSNTSAWVAYALLIGDDAILLVNAVGSIASVLYLAVFLAYSPSRTRIALQLSALLGFVAAVYYAVVLPARVTAANRAAGMGFIAVACNIVMYAAPIAQLRIAFTSYDPTAIPLLLVVVGAQK